jgi:hypothetical protein
MATNADRLVRYTGAFLVALVVALPFIAGGQSAHAAAPPLHPVARPLPPFDLSYLPHCGDMRVVALRPAEIARLYRWPATWDRCAYGCLWMLVGMIDGADFGAADPPSFADIEQCVFRIDARLNNPKGDAQGSMMFGTSSVVLRTVKPFDWSSCVKEWFPRGERLRHAGREYVRTRLDLTPLGHKAEMEFCFFVADDRTLVIDQEDRLKMLLVQLRADPSSPSSQDCLSEASRAVVAASFDNRDRSWMTGKPRDRTPEVEDAMRLFHSLDRVVIGLKYDDRWSIQVHATARTKGAARKAAPALERLLAAGRRELANKLKEKVPGVRVRWHNEHIETEVGLPDGLFKALGNSLCGSK